MLDLQREQFEHDERFHREIVRLDLRARLNHMALHFCKYTGQFATMLRDPNDKALRSRTITDSFVISLCSANALNFNLSEHIAPYLGTTATVRDLGIALADRLYPNTKLDDSWLLASHAVYTAKMATACEKIDHLESFPFREELQKAVLALCQISLVAAYINDLDLATAVRERRNELRNRNPLIAVLTA